MTVERGPRPVFWEQQCPERGYGLRHAHSTMCRPGEGHPGTLDEHPSDACCHCSMRASLWNPEPVIEEPSEEAPLELPQPVTDGCSMNHARIEAKLLIGDDGLEWRKCPLCGVAIEPKLATGQLDGPNWGKGRGAYLTERLRRRLDFIKFLVGRGDA